MRYVDFVHGVNPEDVDFLVGLEVEDRPRVLKDLCGHCKERDELTADVEHCC